jgi:hypothetical protein
MTSKTGVTRAGAVLEEAASRHPPRYRRRHHSRIAQSGLSSEFLPAVFGHSAAVSTAAPDTARDEREAPEVDFVRNALNDVQHNWDQMLPERENRPYHHAKLVLYRDAKRCSQRLAKPGWKALFQSRPMRHISQAAARPGSKSNALYVRN